MKIVFLHILSFVFCALSQAPPGTVLLDSYAGSTDDDKLTAALANVQTFTYIPAIMLSGRTYTFTQGGRTPFNGMKIVGPPSGYFDSELANGSYNSVKVVLNVGTGSNAWFVGTGNTYNIYISHIGFTSSNANSQFWSQVLPSTLYACTFDTLGFFGFKYVFGDGTNKAALTQVNFVGQWTVLVPITGTQFFIGGSDNELWTSGYLNIGSSSAYPGSGTYLIHMDSISKTNVGPIYITAYNGWSGILVSGSNYGLSFTGGRYEGVNAGTPSNGALIVQTGGKVIWRDIWVAYGMANPSANGHSPTDAAMIMHTGGEALWDGVTYDRANNVAETVPLFYGSSGKMRIYNAFTGAIGGWTGLPRVKQAGATFTVDNTVTLV